MSMQGTRLAADERLRRLSALLKVDHPAEIVDIGANPIDGAPPYRPLLSAELCRVTGFEPDPSAFAALADKTSAHENYLPYAIGDGSTKTLHLCRYSGWTSTLRPNPAAIKIFHGFTNEPDVIGETKIDTRRLDDIEEIDQIDYLKIDIQGGELDVFRHATRKLAGASVIQTEASIIGLYENQPSFGDIDVELRRQGFVPHCFPSVKNCMISPLILDNNPSRALNQVIEFDVVYVKDFRYPERLSNHQLQLTALIADSCYHSFDLALYCISQLQARMAIDPNAIEAYLQLIKEIILKAKPV